MSDVPYHLATERWLREWDLNPRSTAYETVEITELLHPAPSSVTHLQTIVNTVSKLFSELVGYSPEVCLSAANNPIYLSIEDPL